MITKLEDFVNEGLFRKKWGVPVLPDDLLQNKDTTRAKKVQELLRKAQDQGAFTEGLSDENMKTFVDNLIEITEAYGYGNDVKNFKEYLERKLNLTSSRVLDFWMDVLDFYEKNY